MKRRPKAKKALLRRAPHLVCYWQDRQYVICNFATGVAAVVSPAALACEILEFFDRWRPADDLFRQMTGWEQSSLQRTLRALVQHSLLQQTDRSRHPAEGLMDGWASWNPAAGFFHTSTKDVQFVDRASARRFRSRSLPNRSMPPAVKRYPMAPSVSMPAPETNGDFPDVLLARRTWRQFARRAIELPTLSTLLWLTWGVQHCVSLPGQRRLILKTSPSGGARQPLEAYVLARRVKDLKPGLYHYAADGHCLELLRPGATSRQLATYVTQPWFGSAAALVLMTAVFPRKQWLYQYARAYRTVLLEAGHFCQTFCLVATWLDLAPFCTAALADSRIERDLGIDGLREGVLYAAGVGHRPSGADWVPWPEDRPGRIKKLPTPEKTRENLRALPVERVDGVYVK